MKYIFTNELDYATNNVDYTNTLSKKQIVKIIGLDEKEFDRSIKELVKYGYLEIKTIDHNTQLIIAKKGGRK